jgi:hypothetical protein
MLSTKNKSKNLNFKVETNNYDIISKIWKDEILNNWADYRKFILIKETRELVNKEKLDLLSKSIQTNKGQIIYLWKLGLPNWLRKKMWKTIIKDKCEICENLYDNYVKLMKDEVELNFQNFNKTFNPRKSITALLNDNSKATQNDILKHINKIIKKYSDLNLIEDNKKFKKDIFTIIKAFSLHRPDIIYSNHIAYVITIFYLNSQSCYDTFYSFCNVVIPSFLFKFIIKDEIFIESFSDFFKTIFKENFPKLNDLFIKYDIEIKLFFHKWIKYLFVKTFQYHIVLRIWDNFFLKGEIFVFEVSLAILAILEKELLEKTKSEEINELLKVFPVKYTENELFEAIDKINITNQYTEFFDTGDLGREKGELLKDL